VVGRGGQTLDDVAVHAGVQARAGHDLVEQVGRDAA
jgi:hypothetical protein